MNRNLYFFDKNSLKTILNISYFFLVQNIENTDQNMKYNLDKIESIFKKEQNPQLKNIYI